jgi:LPS O-antigen subunit length determinant protein (WzzB/FepE family)
MKPLNTLPIEDFLNRTRIAAKSNQKTVILDIKEAVSLADSLAIVMTRLAGDSTSSAPTSPSAPGSLQVKMDGGNF